MASFCFENGADPSPMGGTEQMEHGMSIGSLSNSTDSAASIGVQSCMQMSRAAGGAQNDVFGPLKMDPHGAPVDNPLPKLTLEAFAALDLFDSDDAHCSPAQALKMRQKGHIAPDGSVPTLQSYLTAAKWSDAGADSTLRAQAEKLPKIHAPLAVYFIPRGRAQAKHGVVMPGNYVAISKSLARMMAQVGPNVPVPMLSTTVYPDELVYHGHAHGFVYVPRSVQAGFERYQADVAAVVDTRRTLTRPRMLG